MIRTHCMIVRVRSHLGSTFVRFCILVGRHPQWLARVLGHIPCARIMVAAKRSAASAGFDGDFWQTSPAKPGADLDALTTLAERVPKAKKSQDQQEMNRRLLARSAVVRCVDYLMKNPSAAAAVWNAIESGLIPEAGDNNAAGSAGGSKTELKISSYGKLPSDTIAAFFAGLDGGPSKAILDLMDAKDADAIRDVGTMMLQLRRSDSIPKCCSDPRVLTKFLKARLDQVGPRIPGWFGASVSPAGIIDWGKQPLFTLEWAERRLVSIKHMTGDIVELPQHVVITADFQLEHPHSDADAALVLSPAKQLIRELFAADQGPNRFLVDRRGKSIVGLASAAEAQVKADDMKAAESAATPETGVLATRKQEAKTKALERARQVAAAAPKRLRSVQFGV